MPPAAETKQFPPTAFALLRSGGLILEFKNMFIFNWQGMADRIGG